MSTRIEMGMKTGRNAFGTDTEFLLALDRTLINAIQAAKLRTINFIRSPGPNRGFLFPKDTSALIRDGMIITSEESTGGLDFEFAYGFDIFYAEFLENIEKLHHIHFWSDKIPRVKEILQEEIDKALKADGFEVEVTVN